MKISKLTAAQMRQARKGVVVTPESVGLDAGLYAAAIKYLFDRPVPEERGQEWYWSEETEFPATPLEWVRIQTVLFANAEVDLALYNDEQVGAYFSDRGRLFQSDRGRSNGVREDAPGRRTSTGLECSSIVHDEPETLLDEARIGHGFGVGWISKSRPLPGRRRHPPSGHVHMLAQVLPGCLGLHS